MLSFALGLGVNIFENGQQKLCIVLLAIWNGRSNSCRNYYNVPICSVIRRRVINFEFWIIANDLNFMLELWWMATSPSLHNAFISLKWTVSASCGNAPLSGHFDSLCSLGNIHLHWRTLSLELFPFHFQLLVTY